MWLFIYTGTDPEIKKTFNGGYYFLVRGSKAVKMEIRIDSFVYSQNTAATCAMIHFSIFSTHLLKKPHFFNEAF
mgnify:CR=1 FL=1